MCNDWATWTDAETVAKRAGGRRKYNSARKARAAWRRVQVANLVHRWGMGHGYQRRIAGELGVSAATVCRDLAKILAEVPTSTCPHCHKPTGPVFRGLRLSDLAPIDMADVRRKAAELKRQMAREQIGEPQAPLP